MDDKWSVPYVLMQLKRVYCGGLIPQVILHPNLQVASHSADGNLAVFWEGAAKELLEKTVGVMDLGILIRCLDQAGEYAYVNIKKGRLVVTGEDTRSATSLVTGHIAQIRNVVEDDVKQKILGSFEEYPSFDVPVEALKEVTGAIRALKTEVLTLSVGPEESYFIVGGDTQNRASICLPEIQSDQTYTLTLPSDLFTSVVSTLNEGTVTLHLSGPDSAIKLCQATVHHVINNIFAD